VGKLQSKSQAPVKKNYPVNLEILKPLNKSYSKDDFENDASDASDTNADSKGKKIKSKLKFRDYNYITNVDDWLKKNRLDAKTKVFIITCGYECISEALKKRGWVKNPGYNSPCFHLKFTLKGSHIPFDSLQPY